MVQWRQSAGAAELALPLGCVSCRDLSEWPDRGDCDGDGQAAVIAGAGGGGAAVDCGDGRDDGEAEPEAVVGDAGAEPLERLEDPVGVGRADEAGRCSRR